MEQPFDIREEAAHHRNRIEATLAQTGELPGAMGFLFFNQDGKIFGAAVCMPGLDGAQAHARVLAGSLRALRRTRPSATYVGFIYVVNATCVRTRPDEPDGNGVYLRVGPAGQRADDYFGVITGEAGRSLQWHELSGDLPLQDPGGQTMPGFPDPSASGEPGRPGPLDVLLGPAQQLREDLASFPHDLDALELPLVKQGPFPLEPDANLHSFVVAQQQAIGGDPEPGAFAAVLFRIGEAPYYLRLDMQLKVADQVEAVRDLVDEVVEEVGAGAVLGVVHVLPPGEDSSRSIQYEEPGSRTRLRVGRLAAAGPMKIVEWASEEELEGSVYVSGAPGARAS